MQHFLPPSIMYIAYFGIDRKNKWMRILSRCLYVVCKPCDVFFLIFFVKFSFSKKATKFETIFQKI